MCELFAVGHLSVTKCQNAECNGGTHTYIHTHTHTNIRRESGDDSGSSTTVGGGLWLSLITSRASVTIICEMRL